MAKSMPGEHTGTEAETTKATDERVITTRDAEVLYRKALSPSQAVLALKRWYKAYDAQWQQYAAEQKAHKAKAEAARLGLRVNALDS